MSTGLLEQLHSYYEHESSSQDPITDAEVRTLVDLSTQLRPPPKRLRRGGVWVAVAAAVITVLIIGLIPLFAGEETPPVDSVVPTTVAELVTPTTTPVETAEKLTNLTNSFSQVDYVEVESVVGSLSWTLIEGDPETLPLLWAAASFCDCEIEIDPEGGYLAYTWATDTGEGWRLWRSDDALTWSYEVAEEPPSAREWDFAPDELQIVHKLDGETTTVELEAPPIPLIEGLEFHFLNSQPEDSGNGVVLVAGSLVGSLPWADIYGTIERCEPSICFDEPPFVQYGEVWIDNEQLSDPNMAWVVHLVTDEVLATLEVEFGNTSIRFTDTDTGDLVHEIRTETEEQMKAIRSQFVVGDDLREFDLETYSWIGSSESPFVVGDPPPGELHGLMALPDGGIGQFSNLYPDIEGPGEVHVSHDGLNWTSVVPQFLEGRDVAQVWVQRNDGQLVAEVYYRAGGEERWVSTNGVDWTYEFQYPADSNVYQTEWGWVAMGDGAHWVSIDDGASWARLPAAPAPGGSEDGISSLTPGAAVGNIIWFRRDYQPNSDGEFTRLLWIGHFNR